jgi:hypothetical protein
VTTPTLSLSILGGPVNTPVTATGSGFTYAGTVTITVGSVAVTSYSACSLGTASAGTITTTAGGGFACTFVIPAGVTVGANTVTATDGNSAATATATFTVTTPALTLSIVGGPVNTQLVATGSGFAYGGTVTIKFATIAIGAYSACSPGSAVAGTITTTATGGFACTFVVPATAPVGADTVTATDAMSSATATATFTVTTPTLTLSILGGPVGTKVVATGAGFTYGGTVTITFGAIAINAYTACSSGTRVAGVITTTATGGFACTFAVPGAAPLGANTLTATDGNSGKTATATFTVTSPTLTLSILGGPVNTQLVATGAGFTYGGAVTITFGAISVASYSSCTVGSATGGTITSSASGAFACTFAVPATAPVGADTVTATDGNSGATATATFTVTTPSLVLSIVGGPVNTQLVATGAGFTYSGAVTETFASVGITSYSACTVGSAVGGAITVSAGGGFSCTFKVPAGVALGLDTVTASDVNSGATATATFTVTTPTLTLSIIGGPRNTQLVATGAGFTYGGTASISFGAIAISAYSACSVGSAIAGVITTSATGTFACTFVVPAGAPVGANTVTATDANSGATATATFTVTTPTLTLSIITGPDATLDVATGAGFTYGGHVSIVVGVIAINAYSACSAGSAVAGVITTTATGTFSCTFTIPAAAPVGANTVTATDANSAATATATFTVTMWNLVLSPNSGPSGTTVTLTGSGYAPSTLYNYCWAASGAAVGCSSTSQFTSSATGTIPSSAQLTWTAGNAWVAISQGPAVANFIISSQFTPTVATLVLTPASGPVGTLVTISGGGFGDSVAYTYCFALSGTAPCLSGTSFTTTAAGALPGGLTVTVPAVNNSYVDVSEQTSSNFIISAAFTVTVATLVLTPNTGPSGTLVTLTGSGYAPLTGYTACFTATGTTSCSAGTAFTTLGTGAIPVGTTINVPASANTWVDVSQGPAAANFIISAAFSPTTATLVLTPNAGPTNTLVTLSGTGYGKSTVYTYCFSASGVAACAAGATFTTTAAGAIPSGVTISVPGAANTWVDVSQTPTNFIISAAFTPTTASLTLVLTPSSGPDGTIVTLTGNGYAPGTTYTYCLSAAPAACASGATFTTASGSGGQSIPAGTIFNVPAATAAGAYVIDVSQGAANLIVDSAYTVTTPTLVLSLLFGPSGTIVGLSGTGYGPAITYTVCMQASGTASCASGSSFTATGAGAIPAGATFTIPTSTAGAYFLDVSQGPLSANFIVSAAFTVTSATLTLSPNTGPAGTLVTLSGTGYADAVTYLICFQGTQTACPGSTPTTFTSTAGGAIPALTTLTVPATGTNYVDVTQITSNVAAASFTLTVATLTLTPATGPVNTLVTLSGTGFAPGIVYTFCFSGSGSAACAAGPTFTATAGGAIPAGVTISVPAPPNTWVDVSQGAANFIIAASYLPTAITLVLAPASGPAGTQITLSGTGYAPSTAYTICLQATASACAAGTAFTSSATGTIPAGTTFNVPAATAAGGYFVDISQGALNLVSDAAFTVTTATLLLTPNTGPAGTLVTISGGGYAPSTTYFYCFSASGTAACAAGSATFTATAGGAIPASTTLTVPATANTWVDVSQTNVVANFIIASAFGATTPTIILTPTSGPGGTLVAVSGTGYAPTTVYTYCLAATSASCASGVTFTSSAAGIIPAGTFLTVPLAQAAGSYFVDISQGSAAANFIISEAFVVTTASLTITPSSGPANTLVTLTGSGFTPLTTYAYCFQATTGITCPAGTLTTFTTPAAGTIPAGTTISVPATGNAYVDISQGTSTNFIISAAYALTVPTLTLSLAQGPAGTLLTLSGTGYAPSTAYTVCLQATASACASGTSFTSGATGLIPVGTTFTVPLATAAGAYFVDVSQTPTNYIDSAAFTVTTATLVITPNAGPTNTLVTLTGSGYAFSTVYTFCFSGSGVTACAAGGSFTTTAAGAIPASTTISSPSSANTWVDVSMSTTNFIIAAAFTPTTATLVLTPSTGPAGMLVTLTGTGYAPGTTYTFCLSATAGACASGTTFTTASGAGGQSIPAGTTFTVPLVTSAGGYFIDVSQGASNLVIDAALTVDVPTLSLAPTQGPFNTLVTLSGTGYTPSGVYLYCFQAGASACPVGTGTTFTATAAGAIPSGTVISVPVSGTAFVDVSQGSTNYIISAAFTQTAATLTVAPASGPVNTLVNLTGTGYAFSTTYTVCLQVGATPCASGTTFTSTATGAIPAGTSFNIPAVTAGPYFVDVSQGSTNYIDSAAFTVTTATLVLTPNVGPVGTNIVLSGGGYSPSLVYYYCYSLTNGGACISLNKTFTATAGGAIPAGTSIDKFNLPPTWIEVVQAGTNVVATAQFTVTTATLVLSPSSGPAGTRVTLTGTGYAPSTTYTVCLAATVGSCASGTTFTTASGAGGQPIPGGTTFTVPLVTVAGSYFIDVSQTPRSTNLVSDAAFTVTSPTLTLTPASGPVNTLVTLSGTGFAPTVVYTYCFQASGVAACAAGATFTSSAAGAIPASVTITVPASANAFVDVSQGATNFIVSAAFTVGVATLSLSPSSGPAGTQIGLSGANYAPSTSYLACFASTGTFACSSGGTSFTTTATGTIPAWTNVSVPAATPAGGYFVDVSQGPLNFIVSAAFTVTTATLSASPASGPAGTLVTLTGTGYGPSTTYTACFSASASASCASGTSFTTTATGAIPSGTTVTAPATANTWIDVSQSPLPAAFIISTAFGPTTATLTLSVTSGPVGTVLTLTGSGYAPNTFYTDCFQTTTTSCASGNTFTTTLGGVIGASVNLIIPADPAGPYFVDVSQGHAAANFIIDAPFTVKPALSLAPAFGPVGTMVTATGSGFGNAATVTVTWPGGATMCTATASALGAWSCTFTVPTPSIGGADTVTATDSLSNVATAVFTVMSSLTITPTSDPVGATITITGYGFAASTGVSVTWVPASGATTICSPTTTATGTLTCTYVIPHTTGQTYTITAGTASAPLTVTPSVYGTPSSGPVGTVTVFSGTGFLASQTIGVVWGGTPTMSACPSSVTTTLLGDFTCSAFTVPVTPAGNVDVTANQTVGSTFLQATTVFTVTTTLAIAASASVSTTDQGVSITFTGTASGGATPYSTYGFAFGDGGTSSGSSNSASHAYVNPGTYTVSITVTDAYGSKVSGTTVVTINAKPTVSTPTGTVASADVGQSVTFRTTASLGTTPYTTYTWTGLPTGCSGATASVTCSGLTTAGTYSISVTVTDTVGVTSTASNTLAFTVYADPTVTTPSANHVSTDVGQSVTFTISAASGSGGFTYSWSGLPTGCSGSTTTVSCTTSASGSYTVKVTVTDSNGESATSGSLAFTVYADPSVTTPTASPSSVDIGQTVTISATASSGSGGYTYSWSGLPTGCSGSSASVSCTPSGSGAFTISVTVTDSNGYQVTSSSESYTVDTDPSVSTPSASPVSVDVGQSASFSTSETGGSGGLTYSWAGLPAGCSGSGATISCSPTGVGTFSITVSVTDSNSYTSGSGALSFTVHAVMTVANPTSSTPSVDVGQSVTFTTTASLGSGGYSYAWTGLPAGCSGATASISCSPTTAGTSSVSVKVTDSNGASVTSGSLSFTVYADLVASGPTESATSVDVGQSAVFNVTASLGSGGYTFAWTGLPAGCSGTSASVSCAPTAAGTDTVSVTVSDSNGFHVTPGSVTFTVHAKPSVSAPAASAPSVDVGQSVTFTVTASFGTGTYAYAWTGLPSGCSSVTAQTTCTPTTADSYSISVTVTDSNSVVITSTSLAFTVYADPSVSLMASHGALDVGQATTLNTTVSPGSGADTFSWSGLPVGCSGTGATVVCTPTASGTSSVSVKLTDSNGYSVTSNSVIVVVNAALASSLTLTPASPVSGNNVTFSATTTGGTAPLTYTWSFGDGSKTTTGQSVSHTYGSSGTYTVTLWVNDSSGGSVMKTLTVTVAAAPLMIAGLPATEFWFLLAILLVALIVAGLVLVLRRRSPPTKPVEEYKEPSKPTEPAKQPDLEDQVKELEDMSKTG